MPKIKLGELSINMQSGLKMKIGEIFRVKKRRSGVKVGRAMSVDDFLKLMERKDEVRELRLECKAQKLLSIARGKMARLKYPLVSNEQLLFDRIEEWVNRKGWLPGSYFYMLKMLNQGKRYEEIIPSCHALF